MFTETAVVFYNDRKHLAGVTHCFGSRFDGQALPAGSVVVGMFCFNRESGEVDELVVARPYCRTEAQEAALEAELEYARLSAGTEFGDGPEEPEGSL